ncbi:N-acetyltransferase [Alcanivorax sp. 24]|uniref:N-acetyltransferase n=1 Tax=Alcanivorax sp. 24 TaxID=2545266 RepID=UPI00105B98E1|nr:N-acetyltransferase [Alcanivorax sp. 24]
MRNIEFVGLDQVDPEALLALMNEASLRTHLVDHDYFDSTGIRAWVKEKEALDALPGCRVRGIHVDGRLAGWCGIQPDEAGFELAIVLSRAFWGIGLSVFRSLMSWASEFGHEQVLFHLLGSRPQYRALEKMADKVHNSELLGRRFTTYHLTVEQHVQ